MRRYHKLLAVLALLVTAIACSGPAALGGKSVTINIYYGSEKEEWLEGLVAEYNAASHELEDGTKIVVESTPIGSVESMRQILEGTIQPTVWSPASDLYVPLANDEWRRLHSEDLVDGDYEDLVLSPVVIAMWKPMAEALGWPDEPIGWADIAELATSEDGWEAYGYPEWGRFQFGHTHPDYSNSGFVSVIAEAYAGTGKLRDLTRDDLDDAEARKFMEDVESAIIHYGSSTGFFASRMFERGPSYLSAAVMYENLVVAQESKRLSGESSQLPVVAIYPKEGTFWSNHPYIILNASWVTDEQRAAAEDFEAFLLAEEQQRGALDYGFRPADPSVALSAPLDEDHGVDPDQPKTVLEVPDADVIRGVQDLWREVKKPVDVVVVMDVSGSMSGDKISTARSSLVQFISLLDDRDRLQIILFNEQLNELTPLTELGEKRSDVTNRVSGIIEFGDTRLYDALDLAYDGLDTSGDRDHIRAIVVLSDGEDTASQLTLNQIIDKVGNTTEGGNATKVFTIAFGSGADQDVLQKIAESTGARMYSGDPETINEVYTIIATFF